jgi:hypothetical protein
MIVVLGSFNKMRALFLRVCAFFYCFFLLLSRSIAKNAHYMMHAGKEGEKSGQNSAAARRTRARARAQRQ